MRISDWSSDVCSSDLTQVVLELARHRAVLGPVTGVVRAHCELVDQDPSVGGLEELDGQDAGDTELSGHGERDRKSVGPGKSVSVRVDTGCRRITNKKTTLRTRVDSLQNYKTNN